MSDAQVNVKTKPNETMPKDSNDESKRSGAMGCYTEAAQLLDGWAKRYRQSASDAWDEGLAQRALNDQTKANALDEAAEKLRASV